MPFYILSACFSFGAIMDEEALLKLAKNKRFLKMIVVELVKSPDLLHAIVEASLGRVATKEDVEAIRTEMRMMKEDIIRYIDAKYEALDKKITILADSLSKRIDSLDKRIDSLDKRIDSLDKRIDSLDKRISFLQWVITIWLTILSILITISMMIH